jgi:hypothetical protein
MDRLAEVFDPSAATVKWTQLKNINTASILTNDRAGMYRSDNHGWYLGWSDNAGAELTLPHPSCCYLYRWYMLRRCFHVLLCVCIIIGKALLWCVRGGGMQFKRHFHTEGGCRAVFHCGPAKTMHWFNIAGDGTQNVAGTRAGGSDQMNGNAVMFDSGKILTVGGAPLHTQLAVVFLFNAHALAAAVPPHLSLSSVARDLTYCLNGFERSCRSMCRAHHCRRAGHGFDGTADRLVAPQCSAVHVHQRCVAAYALPLTGCNPLAGAPSYDGVDSLNTAQVVTLGASNQAVTSRSVAPMKYTRGFGVSVALPDGKVFTVGGQPFPMPFTDTDAVFVPGAQLLTSQRRSTSYAAARARLVLPRLSWLVQVASAACSGAACLNSMRSPACQVASDRVAHTACLCVQSCGIRRQRRGRPWPSRARHAHTTRSRCSCPMAASTAAAAAYARRTRHRALPCLRSHMRGAGRMRRACHSPSSWHLHGCLALQTSAS